MKHLKEGLACSKGSVPGTFLHGQENRDPQTRARGGLAVHSFGNVSSLSSAEEAFGNNAQNGINDEARAPIIKHLNIHGLIAILNSFSGKKNHFPSNPNWLKENVSFHHLKTNLSC